MLFALLILHAVVGIVGVGFHRRLGRWGFALAAVPAVAMLAYLVAHLGGVLDGETLEESVSWVDDLGLELVLRVDAFAALMVLLVSGIGLLVCLYAIWYFSHPKPGTGRLAGLLTLFAGSMLGVVISDHLLALFVFWELTTITSYLLIGNDDTDPAARDSALMAILITGAGGLVMLAGLVMLGQTAGTYQFSELEGAGALGGGVMTAAVICILVGAFTKSAQFPFSMWLPGAMVAPTPISTYLHAATMVKAGVFLIARLSPTLHTIDPWEPLVVVVGGITMVVGGWRALRQHDLKLLLAHGTVSQLGFMTMLVGVGVLDATEAGATLLLAHGAFKAALFMVVGIVDHQAGTRDVRRLGRLGPGWSPVLAVAIVSAASMAGLPPLLGFIAKEQALEAATHDQVIMLVAIIAGSVLTFAYSGRYVLGLLGRLAVDAEPDRPVVVNAPPPVWPFAAPAALLAAVTLAAGVAPAIVDDLVVAATEALHPGGHAHHLHLWAGVTTALVLSACIIAAGAVLVALHHQVAVVQSRVHRMIRWLPTSERIFWATVRGLLDSAKRITAVLQNGSLPIYLMIILAVAALAPLGPAIADFGDLPAFVDDAIHIPIAAIIIGAAVGATIVRRRIAAALMLGAVGYAMAGLFIAQGAPDLALTQFAIETLATVLFVLVLRFLPSRFDDRRPPVTVPLRLLVSVAVGISVFVLALVAAGGRDDVAQQPISDEMIAASVPEAHGHNVVNVILVDFRGLDTMGEITVLVVAALGAVALARAVRLPRSSGRGGGLDGFARLPVVTASLRILFPSIMVLSLFFLFAGHNQPGGGFVGGLTVGAAISLRYVSGGVSSVRRTFRPAPWTILGSGLVVAMSAALVPELFGNSILEHAFFEFSLPLIGEVNLSGALAFDIGVYLVVIGLVLMAFEAFGDDIDPEGADDADAAASAASRPELVGGGRA